MASGSSVRQKPLLRGGHVNAGVDRTTKDAAPASMRKVVNAQKLRFSASHHQDKISGIID